MKRTGDPLVDDYLKRLERELSDLPEARRRELMDEILGHIEEARSDLGSDNEAELRNVLDRLGDPAEIAAEERVRPAVVGRRGGWLEISAIVGLLVGGFLFVIGWFVGLVLLWVSDAWTTAEKLVGTLLVPGGLVPAFLIVTGGLGGYSEACASSPNPATGALEEVCTGGPSLAARILWIAVFIVSVVGPFFTTAFLATRMRRQAAADYQPSPGSA